MLPPKAPGHSPPNASSPAGATATRPSIGRRSIVMLRLRLSGSSVVAVIDSWSIRHS